MASARLRRVGSASAARETASPMAGGVQDLRDALTPRAAPQRRRADRSDAS
jgi:hypothetical protein